jgi:antitoxin (DNA-binding transcriptional repressor) of toxin-antitoxin stability system
MEFTMPVVITVTEMRRGFGRFLQMVEAGQDIIITRRGRMVARLSRCINAASSR